jgi:hypothetical protein
MAEAEQAMASAEHSMMAAEAKAAAALNVSGSDSLILGGAALFLVVGDVLLGVGITLPGVLAGEVILFLLLIGPRAGRVGLISAGATQAVVAALAVAVLLFALGDFILSLKNLSGFTGQGIVAILAALSRWAGAVLMGLGVLSAWTPTPAGTAVKK